MPAYFRGGVDTFLGSDPRTILGQLTKASADAGFFQQTKEATQSWEQEVAVLQHSFREVSEVRSVVDWGVLLEYPIPRRSKRIDVVLLAQGIVLVLEFKCGGTKFNKDSRRQVEDYCLDLRDFQVESHDRNLVPILIATDADDVENEFGDAIDQVAPTLLSNSSNLGGLIVQAVTHYGYAESTIDSEAWDHSKYHPTPTIIESAQHLYAGQNVREISRSHGGAENLTRTTDAVIRAIERARRDKAKTICFITGVPGAGKTLAGLNIVHNHKLHDGDLGAFLSGNGPLVKVLSAALAKDDAARNKTPLHQAKSKVSTFIHNIHAFIGAYDAEKTHVPPDKVIVFDEAQRAWNAEQARRKFNRPHSEPEMVLEIMDRHPDWAVVVALIGGGQEINSGEAGLSEWGRNLIRTFPHWRVMISPELTESRFAGHDGLFDRSPDDIDVREDESLHLNVSLRSFRADGLSRWVAALLEYCPDQARKILESELEEYPIVMTRSLDEARGWLRCRVRGTRRAGLLASSGARRLRPEGLDVGVKIEVENWFLNPDGDVRSSFALEQPATEFDIQGLELDWAGLAWGNDLVPGAGGWRHRQFRGTRWLNVKQEAMQQFIVNKYRVLLTRAREGVVIYVPRGDDEDPTRPRKPNDDIATYLASCGVRVLEPD
jgi:schlafen family protein